MPGRRVGQTSGPETYGDVELAEDFDANDPLAWIAVLVRQADMDFVHEVGMRFAKLGRLEVGCDNACEANASLAIEPSPGSDGTALRSIHRG